MIKSKNIIYEDLNVSSFKVSSKERLLCLHMNLFYI